MQILSAHQIAQLARSWLPLLDASDDALCALAAGTVEAPLRTSLPLEEGELLTMPGRITGQDTAIVKLVSVVPGNVERGLPTIQGVATVVDARTGAPLALLDGAALTAVRTAAVTAAAARRLADPAAHTLALLGAGGQALWLARALAAVLPLHQLTVWSPTQARRERLARQLDRELAVEVRPVAGIEEGTREAGIVCCATTAPVAFLHAEMVSSGPVAVLAIGAFRPDMAEVGPSIFARAGTVWVDDVTAILHEAGDVLRAIHAGALHRSEVRPIGDLLAEPRPLPRVRLFKSVGSAVEDAAVAAALVAQTGERPP